MTNDGISIGRRQLLFRAWDTEKQEMFCNVGAYSNDIASFWFSTWEQWYINTKYAEDEKYNDRFVVMVSIGAKDKDDDDIFEGDIVKYIGPNYYFQGTVVWDQTYDMGKWVIKCEPANINAPMGVFSGYCYSSGGDVFLTTWHGDIDNIKIIGNIFDNPCD